MKIRLKLAAIFMLAAAFAFNSCADSGKGSAAKFYPVFDLQEGNHPIPFNAAFIGTTDGTLQIPFTGDANKDGLIAQLNTLDGWSTTSPVKIPFSRTVDGSTLKGNVHVLNVLMTSASNAQMFIELLERTDELAADLLSGTVGKFSSNDDFFLDPASAVFNDDLDYEETARIFAFLAAAHEIYLHGLEAGGNEPLTGHIIPVQACGDVTNIFEIVVAQGASRNVLLKPRTPLKEGCDLTCAEGTDTGMLKMLYNELAGQDVSVALGDVTTIEASDLNELLEELEKYLGGGSNLTSLANFSGFTGKGSFDDGAIEFNNSFSNGYLPVVTRDVKSTGGDSAGQDWMFSITMDPRLEGSEDVVLLKEMYRAINNNVLQGDTNYLFEWNISLDDIAISFPFSTQSITPALSWIRDEFAGPLDIKDVDELDMSLLGLLEELGDDNPLDPLVFSGFRAFAALLEDVPYFLNNKPKNIGDRGDGTLEGENPTSYNNSLSIGHGLWEVCDDTGCSHATRYNIHKGLHVDDRVNIPVVIAIPDNDCEMPASGWPVSLHGHGNGRTRADMITIAGRLAEECIASVAIDDVLHGTFPRTAFFPLPPGFDDALGDLGLPQPLVDDIVASGSLSFRLLELLINIGIADTVMNELIDEEVPDEEFVDELYRRVLLEEGYVRLVSDHERHFFIDLLNDGEYDDNTGQYFFMHPIAERLAGIDGKGLGAGLTTRDQHRQSISDKIHLVRSLKNFDHDGHTFDENNIF